MKYVYALTLLVFVPLISIAQVVNLSGYLIDDRDGNKYRTIVVSDRIWMAENINYKFSNPEDDAKTKCPGSDEYSCEKYGRLYQYKVANYVCPSGWHLPDDDEWINFTNNLEGEYDSAYRYKKILNSDSINLIQAGFGNIRSQILDKDRASYLWSSTTNENRPTSAMSHLINNDEIARKAIGKNNYLSVRCVSDSILNRPNPYELKEDSLIRSYSVKRSVDNTDFDGFYIKTRSNSLMEVLGSKSQRCTFIKDVNATTLNERIHGEKKWFTVEKKITEVRSVSEVILKGNDFSDENLASSEWIKIERVDLIKPGFVCPNSVYQKRGFVYVASNNKKENQKLNIGLRGRREGSNSYRLKYEGQMEEGIYALRINDQLYCFKITKK